MKEQTWKVLSYCEIPREITEKDDITSEAPCDSYIEHTITPKDKQKEYDDDFDLDNWIIDNYPEAEGETILIHMDY
jgi:hypothetical protein